MNNINFKFLQIITVVGLFANINVFADTLQLNGINNNLMQPLTINFKGTSENIEVGALKGTIDGITSFFFCYDLNHTISAPGTYTATLLSTASTSFPADLLLPPSFNIEVATSMVNTELFTFNSLNQYTGLQLAIWTILYDWSPGVTPNLNTETCKTGFCAPGASKDAIIDANLYLAQAEKFAASFPNGQSLGYWNLIESMDGNHINQVLLGLPEPGTYGILGSFLALTLCVTKYKKYA